VKHIVGSQPRRPSAFLVARHCALLINVSL